MAWDPLHMGNRVRVFALLALLLVASIPHLATPGATPRAQPQLLQLSASDPFAKVRVIVRAQEAMAPVEDLTVRSGGVIRTRLPLIDAFAAELPAGRVADLALAPGVRWVSLDAPLQGHGCRKCGSSTPYSKYVESIGAARLRAEQPGLAGQGIGVAIVDSGIDPHEDFTELPSGNSRSYRVLSSAVFGSHDGGYTDKYGHGTHVAGIVGGNGRESDGRYVGVAPRVNLINVKVAGSDGASYTSDLIAGLQWIHLNRLRYNIRVVNISLNSSVAESYHTSPLDAAVEILWFNRLVVVVSAGNTGGMNSGVRYPPANDPFVITVGASDDRGTAALEDDTLAPYSAQGLTEAGFRKPDVVAPGTNVVSLHGVAISTLAHEHPDHRIGRHYFRMSGTSMSSAVVAGAVALLLQDEPGLTPDQVKFRLITTARPFAGSNAGALNIYDAVRDTSTEPANTGLPASRLLWSGTNPLNWDSVNWDSVNWDTVNWDTVNWDTVNWDTVNWDTVNWDD